MTDQQREKDEATPERRAIRVAIREEDLEQVVGHPWRHSFSPEGEDVQGQGFRYNGVGQTDDDAEGQGYKIKLEPATPDDVEGQAYRNWLEPVDDTEAHGFRWGSLEPAGPDDVEGQGYRGGYLKPGGVEGEDDGSDLWHVELDDTEGQAYRLGG